MNGYVEKGIDRIHQSLQYQTPIDHYNTEDFDMLRMYRTQSTHYVILYKYNRPTGMGYTIYSEDSYEKGGNFFCY